MNITCSNKKILANEQFNELKGCVTVHAWLYATHPNFNVFCDLLRDKLDEPWQTGACTTIRFDTIATKTIP